MGFLEGSNRQITVSAVLVLLLPMIGSFSIFLGQIGLQNAAFTECASSGRSGMLESCRRRGLVIDLCMTLQGMEDNSYSGNDIEGDSSPTAVAQRNAAKTLARTEDSGRGAKSAERGSFAEKARKFLQERRQVRYFAFGANMDERVLTGRRQVNPLQAEPGVVEGYRCVLCRMVRADLVEISTGNDEPGQSKVHT